MDSIITVIFLMLISIKSKNESLITIIATGCLLSEFAYIMIDDVVLYYSLLTMISATLAYKAFVLESTPAKTYSILMAINSTLCCLLIFSFTPQFNTFIESVIMVYNENMLIVVALLAIIGSDNIITRRYHEG